MGIKVITWNEGIDKVHCEYCLDFDGVDDHGKFDPQKQNWKLRYDVVDEDGTLEDNKDHQTKAACTDLQKKTAVFNLG